MALFREMHRINNFLVEGEKSDLIPQAAYSAAYMRMWDAGCTGQTMSEGLMFSAMDDLGLNTRYRTASSNIGVDPFLISDAMIALLGGKKFSFATGDVHHAGRVNETYRRDYRWMAQFHIEFEHIHPFLDWNGRIGRLLLVWAAAFSGLDVPLILDKVAYKTAVRNKDVNALAHLFEHGH